MRRKYLLIKWRRQKTIWFAEMSKNKTFEAFKPKFVVIFLDFMAVYQGLVSRKVSLFVVCLFYGLWWIDGVYYSKWLSKIFLITTVGTNQKDVRRLPTTAGNRICPGLSMALCFLAISTASVFCDLPQINSFVVLFRLKFELWWKNEFPEDWWCIDLQTRVVFSLEMEFFVAF